MAHFVAKFHESSSKFSASFHESPSNFKADFGIVSVLPSAEVFEGSYEVTPKVEAQTIETEQKFMKYDMQINAIPYFDVGNLAGGSTVYIGSEV